MRRRPPDGHFRFGLEGGSGLAQCALRELLRFEPREAAVALQACLQPQVDPLRPFVGVQGRRQVGGGISKGKVGQGQREGDVGAGVQRRGHGQGAVGEAASGFKQPRHADLHGPAVGAKGQGRIVNHHALVGHGIVEDEFGPANADFLEQAQQPVSVGQSFTQSVEGKLSARHLAATGGQRRRGFGHVAPTGNRVGCAQPGLSGCGGDGVADATAGVPSDREAEAVDIQPGDPQPSEQRVGQRELQGNFGHVERFADRAAGGLYIAEQQEGPLLPGLQRDPGRAHTDGPPGELG